MSILNRTFFLKRKLAIVSFVSIPVICAAQTPAAVSQNNSEAPYEAAQLLDGFGAIFVAVGEPVLFPVERAKTCKAESGSSTEAGGCAFVGLLVSPFLVLRDAFVGVGDLLTGGYFKISRSVGVFDYFKDRPAAAASQVSTVPPVENTVRPGDSAIGSAEPAAVPNSESDYTRYVNGRHPNQPNAAANASSSRRGGR